MASLPQFGLRVGPRDRLQSVRAETPRGEKDGAVKSCWVCKKPETRNRPMVPCARCFAAHYCSQECELKDLFQGTHKHYCGKEYARMVYHASRGLCGLGSRATHRDCYGFNKYCIVAKAAFEPGNVVLQAPVMSGALGSLGFLGQAMNVLWPGWRTFLSEVGSSGRDWAPSLGTLDKSVRNMLRFTLFHRGVGRLVHDEEGKERSLGGLLKLVEKELDEGSLVLVRSLAEWYYREKALVDGFWRQIIDTSPSKVDLLRQARASHLMQDSWVRVEVFLKKWVQTKNPDKVFLDSVVFETAKTLSDYVEEYRRGLSQRCMDMCRLWAFCMYTTPFLGLKTLDVRTGRIVRARMPASGDSLLSVSPVCSFLTHSCYHLNAYVSTVDIMEGKECLKDMDLQVCFVFFLFCCRPPFSEQNHSRRAVFYRDLDFATKFFRKSSAPCSVYPPFSHTRTLAMETP